MFAGLPAVSVEEYLEVLGTPEGMRGSSTRPRGALPGRRARRRHGSRLPDIEVPTLYVWSDEDPALGPAGPTGHPGSTCPVRTGSWCSRGSGTGFPSPPPRGSTRNCSPTWRRTPPKATPSGEAADDNTERRSR